MIAIVDDSTRFNAKPCVWVKDHQALADVYAARPRASMFSDYDGDDRPYLYGRPVEVAGELQWAKLLLLEGEVQNILAIDPQGPMHRFSRDPQ